MNVRQVLGRLAPSHQNSPGQTQVTLHFTSSSAATIFKILFCRTMEITAENFREKLPDIEKAIDTATFLAIDGEFTGRQ